MTLEAVDAALLLVLVLDVLGVAHTVDVLVLGCSVADVNSELLEVVLAVKRPVTAVALVSTASVPETHSTELILLNPRCCCCCPSR